MRKVIQIVAVPEDINFYHSMYALCDDGTMWNTSWLPSGEQQSWLQVAPIPQDADEVIVTSDDLEA